MRTSSSITYFDLFLYYLNRIVSFFWRNTQKCWRKTWEVISPPSTADEYRHFTDFQYKEDHEDVEFQNPNSHGTYAPPTFIPVSQIGKEEEDLEREATKYSKESDEFGNASMYYSLVDSSNSSLDKTIYYDPDDTSEAS